MKKRHEVLFNQLEEYRSYLLAIVETVTEEEAEIVPNGFNNNIRWNLGHVYLDQYDWINAVTGESDGPENFSTWFGYGTSPKNFTEHTPALEELKRLLSAQINDIKEKYGEKLETEYPPTEMEMQTIEQVLTRTIFHEGMHMQTILDIKKLINAHSHV
ncbi:DinB family protein [Virgibacillus necropolis]|uniref:DinB family protein n=1 Tax=Virgibacillus necropolis TaxID=163877 RepID=UPI00384AB9B4